MTHGDPDDETTRQIYDHHLHIGEMESSELGAESNHGLIQYLLAVWAKLF